MPLCHTLQPVRPPPPDQSSFQSRPLSLNRTSNSLFPLRASTIMSTSSQPDTEPLLPPPVTQLSAASRSKLAARRYLPSEKAKGKQRALTIDPEPALESGYDGDLDLGTSSSLGTGRTGRNVTIIFSNESESGGGNLELWVEEGESVGSVKEQVSSISPLQPHFSPPFLPRWRAQLIRCR